MSRRYHFWSSKSFWALIAGIVLATAAFVGGPLVFTRPAVEASVPLNLPAYLPANAQSATGTNRDGAETALPTPEAVQVAALPQAQVGAQAAVPLGQFMFTGEVIADKRVPIAVEVIGQVLKVNVDVGDTVQTGDILLQLDSTTLEAQRAQALAGLKATQAQLDQLLLDPDAADLNAARAGVTAAQTAYERALEGPTAEDLEIAEAQLRQARALVKQAQAAYDQVSWNPAIAALPQSLQLEQATLQLEAAEAQYQKLVEGATQDVIDGAFAQLVSAQAQLERLESGPKQPQIDAAMAQVEQAETNLYLAQVQVDKATVRAPIDGVVSKVNTAVGANAAPGVSVFELLSEDVKIAISVEESRLAGIYQGQPATIAVNAYPDRKFEGVVATIAPALDPSTRTVEVTIRPTGDASALAPGMFASVELGT